MSLEVLVIRWTLRRTLPIACVLAFTVNPPAVYARKPPDPLKTARACRKEATKFFAKLSKEVLGNIDACHKTRNKCVKDASKPCSVGPCDDCNARTQSPPDAKSLNKKCPEGALAGLLQIGANLSGGLNDVATTAIQANSRLLQGSKDLTDDTKKDPDADSKKENRTCHDVIGIQRSKLAKAVLKAAIKCQHDLDESALAFGEISSSCTTTSLATADTKAQAAIAKACTRQNGATITGADVGSCATLPTCVTIAARELGDQLAEQVYGAVDRDASTLATVPSSLGIFSRIRRLWNVRRPIFGPPIKIPFRPQPKLGFRNPSRASSVPPPILTVNQSAFRAGGGRTVQVRLADIDGLIAAKRRLVISSETELGPCVEAYALNLAEVDLSAVTGNGAVTVDLEAEFGPDTSTDPLPLRVVVTEESGAIVSDVAETILNEQGRLQLVKDLNPGPVSSIPILLTKVGSRLFFVAQTGVPAQEGLRVLADEFAQPVDLPAPPAPAGGMFFNLTAVGDTLFFGHCASDVDCNLWKTTSANVTSKVASIAPSCFDSTVPVSAGDKLFFTSQGTRDTGTGCELWVTDGTSAPSAPVKNIRPGILGSNIHDLVALGSIVFFVADDGNAGQEIWSSDGTLANTIPRTALPLGPVSELTVIGGEIYFVFSNVELRKLTLQGDVVTTLKTLQKVQQLTAAPGNVLYFEGCDATSGCELWRKSPGADPELVRDIAAGPGDADIAELTPVGNGGALFFRSFTPASGFELWRSDGTQAGTRQVADIASDTGDSSPSSLSSIAGRVFFEASDGTRGREIWESDGTPEGTVRVRDFRIGADDSSGTSGFAGDPIVVGSTLFFPRRDENPDENTGEELWRLRPFDGTNPAATPSPGDGHTPTPTPVATVTPANGSCCSAHGADFPSCNSPTDTCAACVCALDAACCANTWDAACVSKANKECGGSCQCPQPTITPTPAPTVTPVSGAKCCEDSDLVTRSCESAPCAVAVCGADPYCCSVEWDAQCVAEAQAAPACVCPVPTSTRTVTPTPTSRSTQTPTRTPTPTPTPTVIAVCKTNVPAGAITNQTWTAAGSPYCVNGDIQVSLLTIQPGGDGSKGVEVLMTGHYGIDVVTTIQVQGTQGAPIHIAADNPSLPWKGLRFNNTSPGSTLSYAIVENADNSALTLQSGAAPQISNSTFQNNTNIAGPGGAINATALAGNLNISNTTFARNSAATNGGALRLKLNAGFSTTIADAVFDQNTANPSQANGNIFGGAVWFESGDVAIARSAFTNNLAKSKCTATFGCSVNAQGGAVFVTSGTVTIDNTLLTQNSLNALNGGDCFFGGSTATWGSGIAVAGGTVTLTNAVLSCNTMTGSNCGRVKDGEGLYVNGGTVTLINDTVARNSDATGIAHANGTVNVQNSIVFFNNGEQQQIGGTVSVTYSDVEGGFTGTGNLGFNPAFSGVGCTANDVSVVVGSPAIDGGDPSVQFDDACFPPSAGGSRNDMGATGGPGACGF